MQIYALDPQSKTPLSAHLASKQENYLCPECKKLLRLRGGVHRRLHFYHLDPSPYCRQSQKSLEHLNIQEQIISSLPEKEAAMEVRFPKISRIADVVWESKKLIFEVQCSPISTAEVEKRSQDYRCLGYEIIWILHDQRFNRHRLFPCEVFLATKPHYYTNIDAFGKGYIYDQYSVDRGYYRQSKSSPQPVNLATPSFPLFFKIKKKQYPRHFFKKMQNRSLTWKISFEGDLFHCPLPKEKILALNKKEEQKQKRGFILFLKKWILRPYLFLFHMLCEKTIMD